MFFDTMWWNHCAICGKPVHPLQESSAEPLAHGIACISCAYDRVYATKRNHGVPSHFSVGINRDGKWISIIVKDQ